VMVENDSYDYGQQKIRIKIILGLFILFGLVICGRLFYLQVLRNDYYIKIAATQHWANDVIQAKRGKIYVRDEMTGGLFPLADNQTLKLVTGAPEEMDDKAEVARKLAPIIGEDEGKLKELFEKNHTYVPIKHQLTYEVSKKVEELNLKGVGITDEQVRSYAEGTLASQILGYVDTDGNGNYGLEQYFNDVLAGTPGLYKAEIDTAGKRIAFGNNVLVEPKNGTDLVLTMNRDVQSEAEKILKAQVEKYSAENGNLIVMNPDNGEIIAMANYPTYDPAKYKEIKNYQLFRNSSVQDEFEPGSIFKVITMAAGLDTKKLEPDTKYDDTGVVELDGYKIYNSTKKAWGLVDMTFVIQESLNTGVIYVLNQIGKDTFYSYLQKFGFGMQSGIEQPSEGIGRVLAPSETNDHGYATMTFGQNITTTPIQMITSFAAIANGGKLVKPHLIMEKIFRDGKKEVTDNRPIRDIISAEAAAKEKEMMVNQVVKGHGKQAGVKGYKVAGKTGTAQVPRRDGKAGYDPTRNIGSFIGFGPADSPRFVILAKIDSPKGVPWAESTAAPVVGQMFDFLFKYYQIPPTEPIK
jgi:cell division protein FtsI/penicillin-binding protein 2